MENQKKANPSPLDELVMCNHKYKWTLRSGEPYGEPENINAYDTNLIIGKCIKCKTIHVPVDT